MEPRIYISPEPFRLETGHTLPELKIAYHTYGELNAAHDNVVWVCHALTANSDVADWWPHTVETGKFLDPARHFVVCANILGSHYGTTGPLHTNPQTGTPYYRDFPPFTIRDIVRAHILLADALGIGRIGALVGSSVGGFQAVEWAVTEPQRIGKLVLIATSAKQIGMFLVILAIVSAAIVAFIIYSLTMDKIREIAVLKLIGTRNRTIAAMIMQQALALGVIGFVVGKITATFSAPAFPKYVLLTPMDSVAGFFAVLVICVLASLVAIRIALKVDPAEAIGG